MSASCISSVYVFKQKKYSLLLGCHVFNWSYLVVKPTITPTSWLVMNDEIQLLSPKLRKSNY